MDFQTVLESRRSVRSYTGEPISRETLERILFAANAAPVGLGKYDSLHLTVVSNRELLEAIEENTASVFQTSRRSFLYNAPELVLVSTANADNVGFSNAAIVVENMALAAVNEGVGACHIWSAAMTLQKNPELMAKLGIPEGFIPACSIVLGCSEQTYEIRQFPENRIRINRV